MVRTPVKPPISAKIYRHFAAVTLVATLGLAMFSDGENREAVAREVERAGKPRSQSNPNEFVRKDAKQHGSFGTDEWVEGGFGQPSSGGNAASGSGIIPGQADLPAAGMPAGYTIYGVSQEVWATLTEAQRNKLKAKRSASEAAVASAERAHEIDALLAASRTRSGIAAGAPD